MTSPPAPTKAGLRAWWKHFNFIQKVRKETAESGKATHRVFGIPLRESLKYASVQISTANSNGELYVWGYIPVVVAKCGLYLKENATEIEGVFRVSGSSKRMRDLQTVFETPPRYGKTLDWRYEQYTPHDVASVFRRYLTQMPDPVIPHAYYHQFREVIAKKPFNQDEVIQAYKRLIPSLPRANQYLLLYVLDLLSVFARKSEKNRMTATNLAVIFRPGIISHPDHEMSPDQHALSQQVLEFLIAHQDWFMLDIPPPPRQDSILTPSSPIGEEDILIAPSSSDDDQTQEGGWKLVERGKVRIRRRRTMSDKPPLRLGEETLLGNNATYTNDPTDLSPVREASSGALATSRRASGETQYTHVSEGGAMIGRSRTLPSSKGGAGAAGKVLRKKQTTNRKSSIAGDLEGQEPR